MLANWQPDVAILDVNLSHLPTRMNGVELAESVMASHPSCRVLLFSGRPETAEIMLRENAKRNIPSTYSRSQSIPECYSIAQKASRFNPNPDHVSPENRKQRLSPGILIYSPKIALLAYCQHLQAKP